MCERTSGRHRSERGALGDPDLRRSRGYGIAGRAGGLPRWDRGSENGSDRAATELVTDARRRQEVTPATEHRWWQELNQAQLALADAVNRLEAGRIRWDARLSSAMPGVEPTTWWRCYRRIEAGERWVGANASARWVQRVVYATRDRVLDLAGQRDTRLAPLEVACVSAETGMRAAVRPLVAAFGVRETARRLGLPKSTVAALAGSAPLRPADYRALRGRNDPTEMPD